MMKTTIWVLALGLATTTTALAQDPDGPPETPLDIPPVGEPPPPPSSQPSVLPRPPQPPDVRETRIEPASTGRPVGMSFGIGVGYTAPISLQTPTTTSVRLRFPSGLTLEPNLIVRSSKTTQETDTTESDDSTTSVAIGTALRIPMVTRGKFDLELIGDAGVTTTKNNPDGPDNNVSTTTLAIGWGIGVGFWITPHWQVSFSATNPLFSYSKASTENPAPIGEASTSTTAIGAVWDPTVTAMIHLYN